MCGTSRQLVSPIVCVIKFRVIHPNLQTMFKVYTYVLTTKSGYHRLGYEKFTVRNTFSSCIRVPIWTIVGDFEWQMVLFLIVSHFVDVGCGIHAENERNPHESITFLCIAWRLGMLLPSLQQLRCLLKILHNNYCYLKLLDEWMLWNM